MQVANIPAKFGVAWAANAATTGGPDGDGYKRTPPSASQIGVHDGFASFADGFPPLTAQPVASGGVPPYIQDTNGVLGMVTAWDQWMQAGGPVYFDQTFANAIGGYPSGAELKANYSETVGDANIVWLSTQNNNTTDPDSSAAANWIAKPVVTSSVTVLPGDNAGDGGLLTLKGSNGTSDVALDAYNGAFRVFTGGTSGFSYVLASYTLTIGTGIVGRVNSTNFGVTPDVNGNRVIYFSDGTLNQTGHILQDNSASASGSTSSGGKIHINATVGGTGPEVVIDTAGGLTATSLNAGGGNVTNFNLAQSTAAGGASFGTAGVVSLGAVTATGQVTVFGKGIKFFNGSYGASGNALTGQFIYNDVSPQVAGNPQTEVWCENACLWIDSAGGAYIRASIGSPATYGMINVTAHSERQSKTDIAPLTGGMTALMNAPPVRFRYNAASGLDTTVEHVGHLYEDLVAAMPEATLRVGGRGQVDHRMVVPYLHSALLEMQARVEALERRLAGQT